MAVDPQEEVMKRLQGIKDARGKIGELARGKNMYPGGSQARTGGGPDIGRPPTAIPAEAAQAIRNLHAAQQGTQMQQAQPAVNPQVQDLQRSLQDRARTSAPQGSVVNANPRAEAVATKLNRAMQIAAQRKLQQRNKRGR